MALATITRGRAGLDVRHGLARSTGVAAATLSAGLAVLAAVLGWHGADTPNYLFRIDLFRQAGFTIWNMAWYGGHYTVGYSAVLAPLGALVGPTVLGAAAAAVAAVCFDQLLEHGLGVTSVRRRRAATLVFAAGTVTNLAVGRMAFALGLAAGIAAVLAGCRGRWWTAGGLSVVTGLASPVAGFFLALAWGAAVLAHRPRRAALAPMACVGAAAAPVLAAAALFPEGGTFPFPWTALVAVLAVCALTLVVVPAPHRALRLGAGLYAAVTVVLFVAATPLGANAERLGMYVATPILLAVVPRPKLLAVWACLPLLLWWQWSPALDGMLRAGADPSTEAAYYQPLVDFVQAQPAVVGRIEILFTQRHYETAYVAPVVPLARGWERQLDMIDNPVFYGPDLAADSYRTWLLANGVELVARPDAALDPSALREAHLIAGGLPYLEPVWRDSHWQVWRVVGSPGLVSGHAILVARDATSLTLDAPAPGAVVVRVRWTPYWSVAGPACVAPAADGWTELHVDAPGRVVLDTAFFGASGHCET